MCVQQNEEREGIWSQKIWVQFLALPLGCRTFDLSLDLNQIAFYQVKIIMTSLKECLSDMMWVKVLGLIKIKCVLSGLQGSVVERQPVNQVRV